MFITEDDAQNGRDHVDAHRSVLLVVVPFRGAGVSHAHTSMLSMLKTAELILGLPPLNQYDAAATDLADCFTDIPDVSAVRGVAFGHQHLRSGENARHALPLARAASRFLLRSRWTIRREFVVR